MFQVINIFSKRSLSDHLYQTKNVKIDGVLFKIKKIDPLNYLDGSKAMQASYAEYELTKANMNNAEKDVKKIKKYLIDVFMSAVVKPKLTRKNDDGSDQILVDDLFNDWSLVEKLHDEIMSFTYGKKKTQ